jgi:hypothetical protein
MELRALRLIAMLAQAIPQGLYERVDVGDEIAFGGMGAIVLKEIANIVTDFADKIGDARTLLRRRGTSGKFKRVMLGEVERCVDKTVREIFCARERI